MLFKKNGQNSTTQKYILELVYRFRWDHQINIWNRYQRHVESQYLKRDRDYPCERIYRLWELQHSDAR